LVKETSKDRGMDGKLISDERSVMVHKGLDWSKIGPNDEHQ
jgi:hypothetical protein